VTPSWCANLMVSLITAIARQVRLLIKLSAMVALCYFDFLLKWHVQLAERTAEGKSTYKVGVLQDSENGAVRCLLCCHT
jgi:hypothetical protein